MTKITALFIILFLFTACQQAAKTKEAINYNNRAINYSKTNADSALYYFDKAIATDSTYLLAYQNKANLLISMADYKQALVAVDILSSKLENAETLKMKGILHDLNTENKQALENYQKAIVQIDEEVKRVNDFIKYQKLYTKGTLYLLLNKTAEGANLMEKYSEKAAIPVTRRDSVLRNKDNKEELLKILIQP